MSDPIRDVETAVRELGALPVPVGPGPVVRPLALHEAQIDALVASGNRAVNDAVHEDLCHCDSWPEKCLSSGGFFQGYWDLGGLETAIPAVLGLWESMRGGELARLQARAEELLAERHSTNEAPSDAAEALRRQRDRISSLEAQRERRRARLVALQNDALSMRGSLSPNGEDRKVPFELGETLTPAVDWLIGRVAELEAAQGTVFRASHDSIVMGLYTTREAAQAHCEAKVQQEEPAGSIRHMSWVADDIGADAEYELHITPAETSGLIRGTGYVVTPLEVASEYDEEADE
jgi:hypothetical protein